MDFLKTCDDNKKLSNYLVRLVELLCGYIPPFSSNFRFIFPFALLNFYYYRQVTRKKINSSPCQQELAFVAHAQWKVFIAFLLEVFECVSSRWFCVAFLTTSLCANTGFYLRNSSHCKIKHTDS